AFIKATRRERSPTGQGRAIAPLASLLRQAVRSSDDESALEACADRVLIVHARDDHHVPVDFAIAAARRHPSWALRILDAGGHHAHVRAADPWAGMVVPWLSSSGLDRAGVSRGP